MRPTAPPPSPAIPRNATRREPGHGLGPDHRRRLGDRRGAGAGAGRARRGRRAGGAAAGAPDGRSGEPVPMAESRVVGKTGLRPFDAVKGKALRPQLIPDHFLILLTVAHDPAMAHRLGACVEHEIPDAAERAVAARAAGSLSNSLAAGLTPGQARMRVPTTSDECVRSDPITWSGASGHPVGSAGKRVVGRSCNGAALRQRSRRSGPGMR